MRLINHFPSLLRIGLVGAAAISLGLASANNARAADVVLTSALVTVDCSGLDTQTGGGVDLAGPDFTAHFFFGGPPRPVCSPAPVTLRLSTITPLHDPSIGIAFFQGVGTNQLFSILTFDQTSISGFVEGRDTSNLDVVLFRVDFTGAGTGSIMEARSTFTTEPIPEPISLVLFGSGLVGIAGYCRKKKHDHGEPSSRI
jgi:hypothetical protein